MVDNSILAAQVYSPRVAQRYVTLDRICVRDLVLDCRIGVFDDEKTAPQRVRVSVEVAVYPSPRPPADDINRVLSYDFIVAGIRAVAAAGHINLAETLAERIAEHCLSDRRAAKVNVMVEKLDRLPGATLGVAIERYQRAAHDANVYALPGAWSEGPPPVRRGNEE